MKSRAEVILSLIHQQREGIHLNKTCLVIVDLQNGFINEHTCHLPRKIADYLTDHRFSCIAATQYCNTPDTACYRFGGWRDCMANTPAAELVPEILPHVQHIFEKQTFSGFTQAFQDFLTAQHFDMLYFCGVNTDCCVLATVFSCYDAVQDCAVIEDLCASTLGEEKHRNAMTLLKDNLPASRIISSDSATITAG